MANLVADASSTSSSSPYPKPIASKWCTCRSLLPIALGTCCLLVSAVNVWQAQQSLLSEAKSHPRRPDGPVDLTAVHKAVREFLNPAKNVARKDQQAKTGLTSANGAKGRPLTKDKGTQDALSKNERAAKVEEASNDRDEPKYPRLECTAYGGPSTELSQEMVYWQDIPSDTRYVSPFKESNDDGGPKYMTFEPDGGGWNNIRMAMETVLGLAIAMGRTLVLPPDQRMYLLAKGRGNQKTDFGFADFFDFQHMASENAGLEIISMKEFLEREAMTGKLRDKNTGKVTFPPGNRTDWNGQDVVLLKEWLRNTTHTPLWSPDNCLAAFPASGKHEDVESLRKMQQQIHSQGVLASHILDDPPPVDSEPITRMRENLAERRNLCVYDETMRKERVVHFMCYHKMRMRLLVHFYAFLFFEDWREDLWMKRFMRDHVRYIDEIQCAAARIVNAMREHVKSKKDGDSSGQFDTFHVRRGDFQYKNTRIEASEIVKNTRDILSPGSTVYIATDERDKSFFNPLKEIYDVKFMEDFLHLLQGVNSNYYGMIDQLVAARGRIFFGCWHSTFTGFINRMRGYYSTKDKLPGFEKGLLPKSYYYVPVDKRMVMHEYAALHGAFYSREFPTSWRDLDKGIGNHPMVE